jgi:hypothetical protein
MLESKLPPAPWARIHVVRGSTPRSLVMRAAEPMRLTVGSDPSAQFCIPSFSVAPRQLDVLWDGAGLWLEDSLRLGRTFVNGRLLNEWVLVRGEVIVSFGALRLWVAAGGGDTQAQPAPDFGALERASQTPPPDLAVGRAHPQSQTSRFSLPPEVALALSAAADRSA